MSMTGRIIDAQNEAETKNCGCEVSFNDGIQIYCEKHLNEAEAENEYWQAMNADNNDSVFDI